jgi:hypothetical protein
MRIGFDLDGTVADMQAALAREAVRLFPGVDLSSVPTSTASAEASRPSEEPPADGRPSTRALSSQQLRQLWNAACARTNFWETLDEIEPGALARLYAVAKRRRWEVIFLTSRPETAGDVAQAQSHRWLAAHGFPTPSVFVVHGSRGKIASALALDVFVDDRPENCLDIAIDSQARAILVWRDDGAGVPASARQLGIGSVPSIGRCLDILEEIDEEGGDRGTVVNRLKQLLGLKPRPARPEIRQPAAASASSRG